MSMNVTGLISSFLVSYWLFQLSTRYESILLITYLPGATTGDPTHDKFMWKRTVKQGFRTQLAPKAFSSIYPKTRICLFYYFMTFTNSSDINRGLSLTTFSGENQLRAIANKSPGHERNISNQTPSVSIIAFLAGISRLLQLCI